MPHVIERRLRTLAIGIRPTFAAECGVDPGGTVDILDASGINGWRIGVRQLLNGEGADELASVRPVLAWARSELWVERERWRYLAAFVDVLNRAAVRRQHREQDEEATTFEHGWSRNLRYVRQLLGSGELVVSPAAVEGIKEAAGWLSGPPENLVDVLSQLHVEARARIDRGAGEPPPLVLPDYRDALARALSGWSQ